MSSRCLPVLPLAAVFSLLGSLLSAYLLALLHKGTIGYVPHPRDLVKTQPELGIISIGQSLGGSITFAVIFIRFSQVNTFYPRLSFVSNIISLMSGILMLVGLYIIPAFSYDNFPVIHTIGAGVHFGFMLLFMVTQAWITYKHPFNHTKCIVRIRLIISLLSILCPVTYVCGILFCPANENFYYIPQGSEWCISILFLLYLCSFVWDFSRMNLRVNCYEVTPRSPTITRSLLKSVHSRM